MASYFKYIGQPLMVAITVTVEAQNRLVITCDKKSCSDLDTKCQIPGLPESSLILAFVDPKNIRQKS